MRRKHGNGYVRIAKRVPKADPWQVYDSLPPPVRAALQEGPEPFCPLAVRRLLRRLARAFDYRGDDLIRVVVEEISLAQQLAILKAEPWQPSDHGTMRLPSPHLLAKATMQTSGRHLS